jgi:hypothetical protein
MSIEEAIQQKLGDKRWWLTPEEFEANIEAGRQAWLEQRLKPRPVNQQPAVVIDYWLKQPSLFIPKRKAAKRQEVAS